MENNNADKAVVQKIAEGLSKEPAYLLIFGISALFTLTGVGSTIKGFYDSGIQYLLLGFFSFVIALIASVVVIFRLTKNNEKADKNNTVKPITDIPKENTFRFSIIDEIVEAHQKQHYDKVISIGLSLNRQLYIEGYYQIRMKVGEFVEDAALKLNDKETQVIAFIDLLGWSSVLLNVNGKAFKNSIEFIKRGIEIAKQNNLVLLQAKGIRHLGSIEIISENFEKAKEFVLQSLSLAQGMEESKQKQEFIGQTYITLTILAIELNNIAEASEFVGKSRALLEGSNDRTRLCRLFALEGKIAEKNNNSLLAKDLFRKGLEESKKINRKDEMIRNSLGLSRVLKGENKEQAKEHLENAKKWLNEVNAEFSLFGKEEVPLL